MSKTKENPNPFPKPDHALLEEVGLLLDMITQGRAEAVHFEKIKGEFRDGLWVTVKNRIGTPHVKNSTHVIWNQDSQAKKRERLQQFRLELDQGGPVAPITVKITVEGFVGDTKELAAEISQVLRQVEKEQ